MTKLPLMELVLGGGEYDSVEDGFATFFFLFLEKREWGTKLPIHF